MTNRPRFFLPVCPMGIKELMDLIVISEREMREETHYDREGKVTTSRVENVCRFWAKTTSSSLTSSSHFPCSGSNCNKKGKNWECCLYLFIEDEKGKEVFEFLTTNFKNCYSP